MEVSIHIASVVYISKLVCIYVYWHRYLKFKLHITEIKQTECQESIISVIIGITARHRFGLITTRIIKNKFFYAKSHLERITRTRIGLVHQSAE